MPASWGRSTGPRFLKELRNACARNPISPLTLNRSATLWISALFPRWLATAPTSGTKFSKSRQRRPIAPFSFFPIGFPRYAPRFSRETNGNCSKRKLPFITSKSSGSNRNHVTCSASAGTASSRSWKRTRRRSNRPMPVFILRTWINSTPSCARISNSKKRYLKACSSPCPKKGRTASGRTPSHRCVPKPTMFSTPFHRKNGRLSRDTQRR